MLPDYNQFQLLLAESEVIFDTAACLRFQHPI
jgi:hypothetical protein